MISKQRYETMKKEFGTISSWAVWAPVVDSPKSGVGDLSVFESSDLLDVLNPNYVFVGLNCSSTHIPKPGSPSVRIWGNFHCRHRGGKDANLRDALTGTEYEGAYLTDILKYADQPLASKVRKHFKEYPDELQAHFDKFYREIDLLGDVETIFVFGSDALYYVLQCEDKLREMGVQHIIPLIHYSAPKMYKRGAYRDYFQKIIKNELRISDLKR